MGRDVRLNPNSPEGDFSDSNADDDRDGYTNLEEYLHWMATPHYEVKTGETVEIDLTKYTRGFEKNPVYTVTKIDNGTAIVDGNILKITPKRALAEFFTLILQLRMPKALPVQEILG